MEESKTQALWNDEYRTLAVDHSLSRADAECLEIMRQLGYSDELLDPIPDSAIMGINCGAPPRYLIAEKVLGPGKRTLDIGSGSGCDTMICGLAVQGLEGRAIGLDILEEMIVRARDNVSLLADTGKLVDSDTIQFRNADVNSGDLSRLFPGGASFDAITSNCVVCLFDQQRVFPEILNALKPRGVFCFAESLLKAPLPPEVLALLREAYDNGIYPARNDAAAKAFRATIACAHESVASADEIQANLVAAGFVNVDCRDERPNPTGLADGPVTTHCPPPTLTSNKMSPEGVADFSERFARVWTTFEIDCHVVYAVYWAEKP